MKRKLIVSGVILGTVYYITDHYNMKHSWKILALTAIVLLAIVLLCNTPEEHNDPTPPAYY